MVNDRPRTSPLLNIPDETVQGAYGIVWSRLRFRKANVGLEFYPNVRDFARRSGDWPVGFVEAFYSVHT